MKYLNLFVIFFLFFSFSVSAAECTVETLNDPVICDQAGLGRLLDQLNSKKKAECTVETLNDPVICDQDGLRKLLSELGSKKKTECTIETLNDPVICDSDGLNKLLSQLGGSKKTECTMETLNDPVICDSAGLLELLNNLNGGNVDPAISYTYIKGTIKAINASQKEIVVAVSCQDYPEEDGCSEKVARNLRFKTVVENYLIIYSPKDEAKRLIFNKLIESFTKVPTVDFTVFVNDNTVIGGTESFDNLKKDRVVNIGFLPSDRKGMNIDARKID
jgi:hypothetical protein